MFRSEHRCSGRIFAIKAIEKKGLERFKKSGIEFKNEQQILRDVQDLESPHLLKYYGSLEDKEMHYLVTELVEGCNLTKYLVKDKQVHNELEARNIFSQIVKGVKDLHNKKILHRDIKLDNILIQLGPQG